MFEQGICQVSASGNITAYKWASVCTTWKP